MYAIFKQSFSVILLIKQYRIIQNSSQNKKISALNFLVLIFVVEFLGVIEYETGGTFNQQRKVQYIERIVVPYKLHNALRTVYLILDSARCHLTESVKTKCQENKIILLFIPPRLTNLLQPADVCWFAPLKKHYHGTWNEW